MSEYIFNYNQYRNTINKKNNFSFSIIFIVIIILLGTCVFLRPRQTKLMELYFIEIDNFQTYQSALNSAQEISENGGAGYIYFDGKYHVLASFYSNLDSAENVLENISIDYTNSSIFTISSPSFSTSKNLTSAQNSTVENFTEVNKNTIIQIENLIIKYNKNETNDSELYTHLENIQKNFEDAYNDLISAFKTNAKFNVSKDYAKQMKESLMNITISEKQNLLQTLRYELISFVINNHHFLSCF